MENYIQQGENSSHNDIPVRKITPRFSSVSDPHFNTFIRSVFRASSNVYDEASL